MLIDQAAKLSRHSINPQLNGVVPGIHVDVADEKQTKVHHTQLPDLILRFSSS